MNEVTIPAFLLYPENPLSEMMFGNSMKLVQNEECGYRFMLYTDAADPDPVIEKQKPPFQINENHYYFKAGLPAWYCICTMKDDSVINNSVRNWVEKADHFAVMIGAMDQVLMAPKMMRGKAYEKVGMVDMGEWPDYNTLHGFDESHVYGHVFYLNGQLYKKFILVAKRQDCSWRAEVNIPSESEQIIPPDFVPAGQTFGSFYPLDTGNA